MIYTKTLFPPTDGETARAFFFFLFCIIVYIYTCRRAHVHVGLCGQFSGDDRIQIAWIRTLCFTHRSELHPSGSVCAADSLRESLFCAQLTPSFSDSFHFYFVRPVISATSGTLKSHNFIFACLVFFLNFLNYF